MRILRALAVTALAAALSGCVPTAPPPPLPPSPTATPVFASDEEALAAAVDLFERYLEYSDSTPPQEQLAGDALAGFLAGELLEDTRDSLADFVSRGWVVVGRSRLDSEKLQAYRDVSASAVVNFYVCEDLSQTDVQDEHGNSVVGQGRDERIPLTVEVRGPMPDALQIWKSETWTGENFC